MSAICAAESKSVEHTVVATKDLTSTFGHEDGYYYVNSESGLLKVTGVAWLTRRGTMSGFCIENRVALTKAEQKEIGDSQPFMLPENTYDFQGFTINDKVLAKKYMDKMKAKGKSILFNNPNTLSSLTEIEQVIDDAKERQKRFEDRHFPMAVLREAVKKDETPQEALVRGLREECKVKFVKGDSIPEHAFVYERRKNTCLLVYFIDCSLLETDCDAELKAGCCNYFCAKSLDELIDNDYMETIDHRILENEEIDSRLEEFEKKFGEEGLGCDLRYWGGLEMWRECKKHF
tara:strand:- start:34601 stop:35470 length:870 start_codon:yes stop_codon:yes gene_type:complete